MKPARRLMLPVAALALAGALAFTPVLVRGAGTTPTPLPPAQPVPPQAIPPLGIQVASGDHAVAVEHTLSDGTTCLIVVHLIGGTAVVCPTPAPVVGTPVLPVGPTP